MPSSVFLISAETSPELRPNDPHAAGGVAERQRRGVDDGVGGSTALCVVRAVSISESEIERGEFSLGPAKKLGEIFESLSMPETGHLAPVGDGPEVPLSLEEA